MKAIGRFFVKTIYVIILSIELNAFPLNIVNGEKPDVSATYLVLSRRYSKGLDRKSRFSA